ncbi:hypothetical protein DFH09DRAFT_861910, partial [Mycena vulgaris]
PSTISALSNELARYDGRIEALRGELSALETARAALKAYCDDCGALLAPVRRLPSELLVKILIFRAAMAWPAEMAMRRLSQAHLLTLSRVCSGWHTLVVDTPTLWDRIQVDGKLWTPGNTDRAMSLLELALER